MPNHPKSRTPHALWSWIGFILSPNVPHSLKLPILRVCIKQKKTSIRTVQLGSKTKEVRGFDEVNVVNVNIYSKYSRRKNDNVGNASRYSLQ